jgi:hypothetical protein
MPRYFLTRVKIEGFRGINNESEPLELKFRPNTVNSVFAANGIGKSSIYEALNYAIRGVVPKLEGLQAQERPNEYIANRFHSQGVATIELDVQPDTGGTSVITIQVQRGKSGKRTVTSSSGHSDPEALLASLNEDFTLLDYGTFSKFIDSSPLERGRSFSTLLGLSTYSDFRQALEAASDTRAINADLELTTLNALVNSSQETVQSALRRLESAYLELSGKSLSDTSQIATYTAEVIDALVGVELIRGLVTGKTLDEIKFDDLKAAIREAEGGEQRKDLETTIEVIAELDALGDPDPKVTTEQDRLMLLIKEKDALLAATPGDRLRALYNAADILLKKGSWTEPNKCPLCESGTEAAIAHLVATKLDPYAKVSAKADEIMTEAQSAYWVRRLEMLERAKSLNVTEEEKLSATIKRSAKNETLTLADIDQAADFLTSLEKKRTDELQRAKARKTDIEKDLPKSLVTLTEQIGYAIQYRDALKDYQKDSRKKEAATTKLAIRTRWRDFIVNAANVFATAEADLSARKLSEIRSEYKTMFKRIMGINDVVPELRRPGAREDLYIDLSDFHGLTDVSARALLSESYRNALAISVFLSAAVKHVGAPRFIVLDDVTSSFDSGHQWNLMEAIRLTLQCPANSRGLQFIILSHDGLLEKYFDRLGNTADWYHQTLQGWPPRGAVMSQAQDTDRLKKTAIKLLTAGQRKEAEPLIRQYLEFKLLQIINKVQIPVPLDFAIKDHQKMVSNSLEAINTAIKLHKNAGRLVLDPKQLQAIDTMHVPALVGNWITHYETGSGSSLSPPILLSIIDTIDNFAECFRYDDTSGGTTRRRWYKSLST